MKHLKGILEKLQTLQAANQESSTLEHVLELVSESSPGV